MDLVYTIVVIILIDEGHEKSTFFLVGCVCVDITKFIFFSLFFLFFFWKRKREQLDERDPLLYAVCLLYFCKFFFCSSAWTWTLCVCVCTNTHTQSLSSILFSFSSSFFFFFFFFLFWWQVINHMLICGLYLLSLFFLPSTISLNNFYLSPHPWKEEKKKLISPPPHKSFYRLESVSLMYFSVPFFLCVKSTAFNII